MIPGKRINLWAIEKADLIHNYSWGNDPEIVKLTGMSPFAKSAVDIERWYETIAANPNVQMYCVKLNDGAYIGNVELSDLDWRSRCAEVGVMIGDRRMRKQGFGKEAVMTVIRFGFEELGLHRIYAKVLSFNEAAKKLFTSCGFEKEGIERESFFTWGRYWDVERYSILARDFFEKFPYKPVETSAGEEKPVEESEGEKEENS